MSLKKIIGERNEIKENGIIGERNGIKEK